MGVCDVTRRGRAQLHAKLPWRSRLLCSLIRSRIPRCCVQCGKGPKGGSKEETAKEREREDKKERLIHEHGDGRLAVA